MPARITTLKSMGTDRLTRDGATPYLESGDLVRLFPEVEGGGSRVPQGEDPALRNPPPSTLDPLLRHVPSDGALLDTIVDASGWPVAQVLDRLLEFELEGRVEQRPGRVFRRIS